MASKSSGPQLNALRDNYNKLVSKRVMAGKSKRFNGNLEEDLEIFKIFLNKVWNYGIYFVYLRK